MSRAEPNVRWERERIELEWHRDQWSSSANALTAIHEDEHKWLVVGLLAYGAFIGGIILGSVGKLWACGGTVVSAVRHGLSEGGDARPTDFSDRA